MLIAAGLHGLLAIISGELGMSLAFGRVYWGLTLYLGIVATGLVAYFYRFAAWKTGSPEVVLITAWVPLGALVIGAFMWQETPVNLFTIAGAVLVLFVLISNSLYERPGQWMLHHIHNDTRQGDRLLCHLDGFVKPSKGGMTKVELLDLSLGGLGMRTAQEFKKGDELLTSFQVGMGFNQLTLTCRVVHCRVNPEGREYGWICGVEFQKISMEKRQNLVEFLARSAKARED